MDAFAGRRRYRRRKCATTWTDCAILATRSLIPLRPCSSTARHRRKPTELMSLPRFPADSRRHRDVVKIDFRVLVIETNTAGRIWPLTIRERRDEGVVHEYLDGLSRL